MNIKAIIERLKKETDNNNDIVYRYKSINKSNLVIIFNETLTSSDKISDFVIRSLNKIEEKEVKTKDILDFIANDISNFKVAKENTYDQLVFYLYNGFTIILIENCDYFLALETRGELSRAIDTPIAETTVRGSRDSFVENIQTNIGLIRKRIKDNSLWKKELFLGTTTKTKVNVLAINNLADKKLISTVTKKLASLKVDGIITGEVLKNLIEDENNIALPTVLTTEKPDQVANSLLEGRLAIIIDNNCYALILPAVLNDFVKTSEDIYGKSINVTFTRVLKYLALFIVIMGPGIYMALISYNQEIIPDSLLIDFAIQRSSVPFPAFVEALLMAFSFEMIREADLRLPVIAGGALSIVGALILGDAAVSAGIVSPIMIIVIATSAICSLSFNELDLINGLRIYRILFMIGAIMLGIIGVVIVFLLFITKLVSSSSFGAPYLMPFVPFDKQGIKNSIFKAKASKNNLRLNKIEKSFDHNEKN